MEKAAKVKLSYVVASVLCALAGVQYMVGGERLTILSYCQWWHATSDGHLVTDGFRFAVPRGWCPFPFGGNEGVTMTSVPWSRTDESIVAVIDPVPPCRGECLPQLPEKLRGGSLVPVGKASRHEVSGLPAFRMQYRREDNDARPDYVGWLFPEHGLMISSSIPTSKLEFFDDFVARLVADSELPPLSHGRNETPAIDRE